MQPFQRAVPVPPTDELLDDIVDWAVHNTTPIPIRNREDARRLLEQEQSKVTLWKNDEYQVADYGFEQNAELVQSCDAGVIRHLSIKRLDKRPVHDWRELQEIKNMICGPQTEAVELYPAEDRLVDSANQYHLWVLPPGYVFPFGFTERCVSDTAFSGGKQRPRTGGDD